MAEVLNGNVTKLFWNEASKVEVLELDANEDNKVDFTEADNKTVFLFDCSGATTVTIKRGNGIQGAGSTEADASDLVLSLASGLNAIVLDSGVYKNVNEDGTGIKGFMLVNPSAACDLGIVRTPIAENWATE